MLEKIKTWLQNCKAESLCILAVVYATWLNILSNILKNCRAESLVGKVVGVAVAIFVFAIVFPIGLQELYAANWTGIPAAIKTVATLLLPILAIISIVYYFTRKR